MSTIITDNPYTFTVADNMSINAVFEDNGASLTFVDGKGLWGSTQQLGTYNIDLYNGNTKVKTLATGVWKKMSNNKYGLGWTVNEPLPYIILAGYTIKSTSLISGSPATRQYMYKDGTNVKSFGPNETIYTFTSSDIGHNFIIYGYQGQPS